MSDTRIEPAVGAVWSHPRAAGEAYGCAIADVHRATELRYHSEHPPVWRAGLWFPSGVGRAIGEFSEIPDLSSTARERALAEIHRQGPLLAAERGLALVVLVPDVEQKIDRFGCCEWPGAWRVTRVYRAPAEPVDRTEVELLPGHGLAVETTYHGNGDVTHGPVRIMRPDGSIDPEELGT